MWTNPLLLLKSGAALQADHCPDQGPQSFGKTLSIDDGFLLAPLADFWLGQQTQKLKQKYF